MEENKKLISQNQLRSDSDDPAEQRGLKDVEEAIILTGGVGMFQYISFSLIAMGMVCGAFILYSIVYFSHVPSLLCQLNEGDPWKSCSREHACDSSKNFAWKVDPDAFDDMTNWVSTMDLYCTDKFEMSLIGSMFFVGTFTGSFILPRAADIYGRKLLFLIGLALYICVAIALYFAKNLTELYVLMFLGGISETGRYYVAYVYCVEMMPKRVQDSTGLYIFLVFGVAMTYIAVQFWFITKDCYVNNFIAIGLAVISWVSVAIWLPESPRFLFSRKEFDKVRAVIHQIAKTNSTENNLPKDLRFEAELEEDTSRSPSDSNVNKSDNGDANSQYETQADENLASFAPQEPNVRSGSMKKLEPQLSAEDIKQASNVMQLKGTIRELFSIKVYRNNLIIMMIIWSFASFAFFLVPLYIGEADLNLYLISICLAVAEIISSFICLFITHTRDNRKSLIFFCGLSCIGSLGALIFQSVYKSDNQVPIAVMYLLLYVGIVTAFDLVYLLVNDLFPTIFLATSYGACNVVGRFISILSPLMANAGDYIPMLTLIAFSGICVFLAMCLVKVEQQKSLKSSSSKQVDPEHH